MIAHMTKRLAAVILLAALCACAKQHKPVTVTFGYPPGQTPDPQAELERSREKPTESLEAYDYYLRGVALYPYRTKESTEESLRLFSTAMDLDPNFAAPYAAAALAIQQQFPRHVRHCDPPPTLDQRAGPGVLCGIRIRLKLATLRKAFA